MKNESTKETGYGASIICPEAERIDKVLVDGHKLLDGLNEIDLIELVLKDAVSASYLALEELEEEPNDPIFYVSMVERALPILRTAFRVLHKHIADLGATSKKLDEVWKNKERPDSAWAGGGNNT